MLELSYTLSVGGSLLTTRMSLSFCLSYTTRPKIQVFKHQYLTKTYFYVFVVVFWMTLRIFALLDGKTFGS